MTRPLDRAQLDVIAQAADAALGLGLSILAETRLGWPVHDPQVREDAIQGVDALTFHLELLEAPDAEDRALAAALQRWLDCGDHFRQRGDDDADEPVLLPAIDGSL